MTLEQALALTDEMKPNMMERATKIAFLTEIEQLIYEEIVLKHEPVNRVKWPLKLLSRLCGMIENVLSMADLKSIEELGEDADRIRGEIHQAILFCQGIWQAMVMDFMVDMENQFIAKIAKIHDLEDPLTKEEMISFLETVDGILQEKRNVDSGAPVYDSDTDQGTVLLVKDPYSMVYVYWLMTKIDLQNLEMDKYNSDRALFENAYDTMHDWWNRTYMPVQRNRQFRI